MMEDERITVICVDFGMTGSAFRWKDNISSLEWSPLADVKTPTNLVFDSGSKDGLPVAWGFEHTGLPGQNTRECFKAFMGVSQSKFAESSIPGAPMSKTELHHWIREYLRAFCARAVSAIDMRLPSTWKKASIDWSFTVPGSWSPLPVVEDFRRLAENAVSSSLQEARHVRVHTDVTEAHASAMCLLISGLIAQEKSYSVNNTVISCDIGGSSSDVAVSRVNGPGVLIPLCNLQLNPSGFTTVEKGLFLHIMQTLASAGAPCPMDLALRMVRVRNTIQDIREFTDKQGKDWISLTIPDTPTIGSLRLSRLAGSKKTYIEGSRMYIHKHNFGSFLDKLVEGLEEAIDEAIVTARMVGLNPDVIGFCGGGSRNLYITKRLSNRYAKMATMVNFPDLAVAPEMATVTGNCMIWDQNRLRTYISQTSFGIERGDSIFWDEAEECKEPSTLKTPYAWVVNFDCENHRHSNQHRIFAIPTTKPHPDAVSRGAVIITKPPQSNAQEGMDMGIIFGSRLTGKVLKTLGCMSWTVVVDLNKEKGSILSWKKEYQLVCKIVGVDRVEIRAVSLLTKTEIPCKVVGRCAP